MSAAPLKFPKCTEIMESLISFVSLPNVPEDPGFATYFSYLLRQKACIDVTFTIDTPEGQMEFNGHQLILAMRSSVFADEFYEDGKKKANYCFKRIMGRKNPKAFEDMIKYCYGIKPGLETAEEACALFNLATEYNLISLRNLCRNYLRDIPIQPGNVFSMLNVATSMEDKSREDMCYKVLEEKTREVFAAYDLLDVTASMVHKILDLPKLSLYSEYELIKWLFDWATAKVDAKDTVCENARDYLQKLLQDMNFLGLAFEEFALLCKHFPDFFCSEEIASVFLNIAFPGTREMPDWYDKDLKIREYTGSKK